jgi:hypothetical protein
MLFAASEPATTDAAFTVEGIVERPKPFSLIPRDPDLRTVSMPTTLTTRFYRPGFIYSYWVVLRQRIGVERFSGSFQSIDKSTPPIRLDGLAQTTLLVAE